MGLTPQAKVVVYIFGLNRLPDLADYPLVLERVGEGSWQWELTAMLDWLFAKVSARGTQITARMAKVIRLHFGLEDGRARTYEQVGREFDLTRERVRQIEAVAFRRLRHPTRSRALRPFIYDPTPADEWVLTARYTLYDMLCEIHKPQIAFDMARLLSREWLQAMAVAIREGTPAQIAEIVAKSCQRPTSLCLTCKGPTLAEWEFCSPQCERDFRVVTITCHGCGGDLRRPARTVVYRLGEKGYQHSFHSRHCFTKWWGEEVRRRVAAGLHHWQKPNRK